MVAEEACATSPQFLSRLKSEVSLRNIYENLAALQSLLDDLNLEFQDNHVLVHEVEDGEALFFDILKAISLNSSGAVPQIHVCGAQYCAKTRPGQFGGFLIRVRGERARIVNTGITMSILDRVNAEVKALRAASHDGHCIDKNIEDLASALAAADF